MTTRRKRLKSMEIWVQWSYWRNFNRSQKDRRSKRRAMIWRLRRLPQMWVCQLVWVTTTRWVCLHL